MASLWQEQDSMRIGGYRILAHLKTGGMGTIYKAENPSTGQVVALKVLSPESAQNPKRLERFRREARQGARLRHENLVTLYDSGDDCGTYYLTFELLEGIDVEEMIQLQGRVGVEDACNIVIQVARALEYVHGMGAVHRDVKPANILIVTRQGRTIVKLGDFGLARGGLEDECRVTNDGMTVGTVDYMSPEQTRDSSKVDVRSDLYALGCTLYHMLAGSPPFAEGSVMDKLQRHVHESPRDVREVNPQVSAELWAICSRLLAKRAADRYQTPADLITALSHICPERLAVVQARAMDQDVHGSTVIPSGAQSRRVTRLAEDTDDDHPAVAGAAHRVADGQFEHAMRAVASGDFDHGLPLLLNCCRMEPGNLAFFQGLRRAQLARRAAAGLSPWCSPMKHWLLRVWLKAAQKLGRPLCVMQCAEQLLSRDPDDLPAQLALSEAADQAGFRPLAVWLLDSAHVSHPEHTNVSRQLARVLEETGDLHRAGALWETIARADVTDSEAHKKFRDLAADELRCQYHAAQQARRSSA